jgi:hypothetical protein
VNDKRAAIALGLILGALYFYWKYQNDSPTSNENTADAGLGQAVADMVNNAASTLTPYLVAMMLPGNAEYIAECEAVEQAYGLPAGMLARLAWQESRFRADIIEGRKVSSAGAKGMFQLMPIHWKFVNPVDWKASADYAGAMLARLYRRFGSWSLALAAYNWGEGNLAAKGIAAAPTETRNYYTQILADIGATEVLA